jgi:gliding motility-associated-like protein
LFKCSIFDIEEPILMKRKTSDVSQPRTKKIHILLLLAISCLMFVNQATDAQSTPNLSANAAPDTVPLMLVNLTSINIRCSESKDGQIIFAVEGGIPPYTYSIPGLITQRDSIIKHLEADKYRCRVTDSGGQEVEAIITVKKEWRFCSVVVPSAFSPNGDGLNDLFKVHVQDDISDFHMQIFDRWGRKVYDGRDPFTGWDGNINGQKSSQATYIWACTYLDNKKQPMKQQGSMTLIR